MESGEVTEKDIQFFLICRVVARVKEFMKQQGYNLMIFINLNSLLRIGDLVPEALFVFDSPSFSTASQKKK